MWLLPGTFGVRVCQHAKPLERAIAICPGRAESEAKRGPPSPSRGPLIHGDGARQPWLLPSPDPGAIPPWEAFCGNASVCVPCPIATS